MKSLTQEALQELKEKLWAFYGARLQGVYLYGSHARGTAHEGSDIDVMVVLQGVVKPGKEITRMNPIVSDICLRYGLLISMYPTSVVWFQTRRSPFFENVRKEAVRL